MKWLLVTFFALTNGLTDKLCIRCKYFVSNREVGLEFGKCSALPKRTYVDTNYLVTGKITYKEDYWYCSDARNTEHLCGTSGKHFEKQDTLQ
jgi:hypothetical protein